MSPQSISRSDAEMAGMRSQIASAIADGSLVRPGNCSSCGKPCTPDGHHEDYGKPLEVIWLCRVCHTARHAELSGRPPKEDLPKAKRGRPKKAAEPKTKLQPDVTPETAYAIKFAAFRTGKTVGQIIDWMAETMRKQLEAA